jgi:hypothetical protein
MLSRSPASDEQAAHALMLSRSPASDEQAAHALMLPHLPYVVSTAPILIGCQPMMDDGKKFNM